MKQAGIYVNDVFCGILTEDEEGFHFSYDEAYLGSEDAIPVSPTMPLTKVSLLMACCNDCIGNISVKPL